MLTSPESIAEFLEGQEGVKADFTKPHQLCVNDFNFQRKGRNETLHRIFDCIVERYIRIKKTLKQEKSVCDKSFHPILALQATPGGGKSFLLDELAALKSKDFDNYLKSKEQPNRECPFIIENIEYNSYIKAVNKVINMLRDSIAVCITYNGNSSYNFNRIVDDDVERGLVMRILWSYFFDDRKLSWQDFCEKFSTDFLSLDIYTAVQSILYHSKKRVFLCVDETMKILSSTDTNRKQVKINEFLNHLYNPYQGLANDNEELIKFNFILTTLDAVYVQDSRIYLGRDINWVPLRRLNISESAELFSEIIRNLNLDKRRLYVIKKCIADCNGHPRTLENFYQVFNSNKEAKKIHNYGSLITILTNHIGEWYMHISFPVVKAALLGETVRLSHIINTNGEQLSISALISSGVYINSLTEKSEAQFVIPTLSPVSLHYFCLNNKDDGDAPTATDILQNLLTTESSFYEEVMDGKPFEKFHANWELLYRVLRENGKKISLHEIYGLSDKGKKEIEIQLQRKEIVYCHEEIEFPPNGEIYNSSKQPFENLIDYLFVPKKSNNSGFDMVIFERKADESGYIAINIECRFTYRDRQTTLKSNEILDKYENMRRKYQMHVRYLRNSETDAWENGSFYDKSSVGKLKMTENDIYLVFVVWRDIGKLSREVLNNKNIIIVERENLKKIYTPSLVSRPQFYSQIYEQINDIKYEDLKPSKPSDNVF